MGYMNPIENYGWTKFARKADNVGVDGVLLVDCPPEESSRFLGELRRFGIDCIFLVAPTTPKQRLEKILTEASGYIYYVSLRGVTGANNINSKDVSSKLNTIKEVTSLPVVVGFGISSKKSVSEIAKTSADGIVVGSALIKAMEQAKEKDLCPIDTVKNQMGVLRSGLL
jgi:tryptophan synthase alpha chain